MKRGAFLFIRCPETRAACQRELLIADLRIARRDHLPTERIKGKIRKSTMEAMRLSDERIRGEKAKRD